MREGIGRDAFHQDKVGVVEDGAENGCRSYVLLSIQQAAKMDGL